MSESLTTQVRPYIEMFPVAAAAVCQALSRSVPGGRFRGSDGPAAAGARSEIWLSRTSGADGFTGGRQSGLGDL